MSKLFQNELETVAGKTNTSNLFISTTFWTMQTQPTAWFKTCWKGIKVQEYVDGAGV